MVTIMANPKLMKSREAKTRFLTRLKAAGTSLSEQTPKSGIDAMLAFYTEERAADCDPDDDGDMLLLEWGTYDWGDGPAFELGITRQFMDEEDDEPRQLKLKFRSTVAKISEEGNRWCESPDAIPQFRVFVNGLSVLQEAERVKMDSVELLFGRT